MSQYHEKFQDFVWLVQQDGNDRNQNSFDFPAECTAAFRDLLSYLFEVPRVIAGIMIYQEVEIQEDTTEPPVQGESDDAHSACQNMFQKTFIQITSHLFLEKTFCFLMMIN